MKNKIVALALGTFLVGGALTAAPQSQEQAPPQQNAQPAQRHMADPNQQVRRLTKS